MAVAARLSPEGSAPEHADALHALAAVVHDDLLACNQVIVRQMHSEVDLIPRLAAHLVAAGGKRIRPVLTLASAKLCGYRGGDRHVNLAACVEFIHTATLLHDDVVDESQLRRGTASANAVFGNQASVLVGDFLFSRAFQLMTADGSLHVLRILSDAAATIAEGEVLQLATQNDLSTDEERYLAVIQGKTAALFAAACQVGAVVAGRSEAEEQALAKYGTAVGMAFQLVDDALDYAADQRLLGKTVGDDFREGKVTLPVILALHRGNEAERAFWHRTLNDQEQRAGDLAHAQDILLRYNALRDSVERAQHYGAIARDALGLFPDHPAKRALLDIVDFTVERGF